MIIHTTSGDLDESLLDKTEGEIDNDNEHTTWVEYRLKGQTDIVHRSAHVTFKKGLSLDSEMGGFS